MLWLINMKKIPIGVSDFKTLHDNDCYFVDKSLLIKDIIDDGAEVILFTRPRRFGKTLNLSMISYYFDRNNTGAHHYFENLAIWQQGEVYQQQRGKYPVIFITLKDVKSDAFADALVKINDEIRKVYQQYAGALKAYWVNTSDNTLISSLVSEASDYIKIQIEKLLQGELITETIDQWHYLKQKDLRNLMIY